MRAFHFLMFAFVVLAVSLVFADDTSDESEVIEKIELLGGKVTRDDKLPGRPVIGVSFDGSRRFNDKYLHLLKPITGLTTLDLSGKATF